MFDELNCDDCSGMTSFRSSGVEDAAGRLGELRQAGAIDAVVHERAPPLGDDEAHVAQDLQVVRDRRLAQREVIGDVADTDRFLACRQEVEDADAGRIGEGLEPGGVGLGIGSVDRRRTRRGAAGLLQDGDGGTFKRGRHG